MESIVQILRQVPSDGNWQPIIQSLKNKTDVLVSSSTHLSESGGTVLLHTLATNRHYTTVAVGVLLAIQSEHLPESAQLLFFYHASDFLQTANHDQGKVVHREISVLCNKLVILGQKHNQIVNVIRPLRAAVQLTAPNENCLTPAHAYLLQACFASQMYSYAVDFIRSHEILEINPPKTSLTILEYLKYFYYRGVCLIAVKDFGAALEAFTQVIVTPANALSYIVVCSIKKAKLVSLIHTGTQFSIPARSSSNVVSKFWAQELPVYDDIERLFKVNDVNGLAKAIQESGHEVLQKDLNFGLAQQVLSCHTKHRIRNLTKTYITLSLQDIANKVDCNPVTVEKHLLTMIKGGEIHASIDAVTNMVRFGEMNAASTNAVDQVKFNATIEQAFDQTMALSNKLREMHKNVLTSNSYLLKSVHGGNRRMVDSSSFGVGGGIGGYPMDEDFPMDYI